MVEARQDGDQELHRQRSAITASASNDCIAPWTGEARLDGHVYVCIAHDTNNGRHLHLHNICFC